MGIGCLTGMGMRPMRARTAKVANVWKATLQWRSRRTGSFAHMLTSEGHSVQPLPFNDRHLGSSSSSLPQWSELYPRNTNVDCLVLHVRIFIPLSLGSGREGPQRAPLHSRFLSLSLSLVPFRTGSSLAHEVGPVRGRVEGDIPSPDHFIVSSTSFWRIISKWNRHVTGRQGWSNEASPVLGCVRLH